MLASCVGYLYRRQLCAVLADYFPEDGKPKVAKKASYNKVEGRENDANSQSSNDCGVPEDIDAEEWAAKLAARRDGRADPTGSSCSVVVVGGAGPVGTGCGAGPVPAFGSASPGFTTPQPNSARVASPEEGFAGFDGFDDDDNADGSFDERAGWAQGQQGQQGRPQPGHGAPLRGVQGGGAEGAAGGGAASQAQWGDISVLAGAGAPPQPFVDYSQLEGLGAKQQEDEVDWGILTAPPAGAEKKATKPQTSREPFEAQETSGSALKGDDDEDDEFTVFDGFGQDNKPTNVKGAGGKGGGREGMTWDAERKVWERQNQRSFGSAFGGRGGGGSPWDMRNASFRSPQSLLRIRSQANKVFNDAISDSIFKSPSMQRFKARTDEIIADFSASVSSVTSVFSGTATYFRRWFG